MSPCHSSVFVYCVGRHTCPSVVQVHWTAPEWDQPQPSNFCLKESNKVGGPPSSPCLLSLQICSWAGFVNSPVRVAHSPPVIFPQPPVGEAHTQAQNSCLNQRSPSAGAGEDVVMSALEME